MDSEAVPATPLAEWLQGPQSAPPRVSTGPRVRSVGAQLLGDPVPRDAHTYTDMHCSHLTKA